MFKDSSPVSVWDDLHRNQPLLGWRRQSRERPEKDSWSLVGLAKREQVKILNITLTILWPQFVTGINQNLLVQHFTKFRASFTKCKGIWCHVLVLLSRSDQTPGIPLFDLSLSGSLTPWSVSLLHHRNILLILLICKVHIVLLWLYLSVIKVNRVKTNFLQRCSF